MVVIGRSLYFCSVTQGNEITNKLFGLRLSSHSAAMSLGLHFFVWGPKLFYMSSVFHIRLDSNPGYRSDGIQRAFLENGFDYVGFDWQKNRYEFGVEKMREELLKQAALFNPVLIFAHIQNPEALDELTWKALANIGYVIHYTFDVRFAAEMEWMYELAPMLGHTFFACSEDVRNCEIKGIRNVSQIHSSCDMELFKHQGKYVYAFDVSFVGNRYDNVDINFPKAKERQEMIEVLEEKYPSRFMAYGLGQKGGLIAPPVEANVYNYSRIAINQNNFDLHDYTSDRLWRIMASGAMCLTKYFPGIEKIFQKEVHLDWFNTLDEMTELADYYLKDENERRAVAEVGMNYVRENHTWTDRIEEMLKTCDI